jgi:hypothetical protein
VRLGPGRDARVAMEVRELVGDNDADVVGQALLQAADRISLTRAEPVDELGQGGDVVELDLDAPGDA